MIRRFLVHSIDWDVDNESELDDLPTEVDITIDAEDDEDAEDKICDYLSDEYGYCHNGFDYEEIIKVANG